MDNLLIESTKKTPEVRFSMNGRLKISGRSIPEDPSQFYDQLFEWVSVYCKLAEDVTTFDIQLEYLNSGSSKAILNMLRSLVEASINGKKLSVNWYY
jgi:hypothetical protein